MLINAQVSGRSLSQIAPQVFDDKCFAVGITGQQISNWLSDGSPFRIRVGLRASCAYFKAAPMRFNVFIIDIDFILFAMAVTRTNLAAFTVAI
ncbi:hypothetical protein LB572_31770 [Mesorhizobium sp. BH1-1-5]|uniref:hypothetical protein n=1 Tax=unclassified Mesorhizobium TaxID=325217 RepID=UPI001126303F|nr:MULTISPECIES: hypothetical protein [unclassified Mesorhizobium]MBZ9991679.1 hypothetical protein [Mesorhizobium sp. BH1-1-5]TPJ75074.1 hypothetical protein FJ471_01060 [Mesorhizobium sp. B2-7-1]